MPGSLIRLKPATYSKILTRLVVALACSILLLLIISVESYSYHEAAQYRLLHLRWQNTPVPVYIVGSVLDQRWRQVIRQSIDDWNAVSASIQLTESSNISAPITVYASRLGACSTHGNSAPACAFSDPDIFTTTESYFNRCSVEINTNFAMQYNGGLLDLYTAVAQELGHCLGLHHSSENDPENNPLLRNAVMWFRLPYFERRHINDYDRGALRARYATPPGSPPPQPPQPPQPPNPPPAPPGRTCDRPGVGWPNGDTVNTRAVTFSWNPPSNCSPNGYTFRISDDGNPESPSVHNYIDTGVSGTSYTFTFNRDGTFYYHVRACRPCTPYTPGPWLTARVFVNTSSGGGTPPPPPPPPPSGRGHLRSAPASP